jgi:hypothetical protein
VQLGEIVDPAGRGAKNYLLHGGSCEPDFRREWNAELGHKRGKQHCDRARNIHVYGGNWFN